MKRNNIFFCTIALILLGTNTFAQDITTLTFSGRDRSGQTHIQLDRVSITNLTQRWEEVIYYPDTILSMGYTGIEEYVDATGVQLLQNVPNPFDGITDFMLQLNENEKVILEIYDINGRKITDYNGELGTGRHLFRATLTSPQTYLLSAQTEAGVVSIKMLNKGNGSNNSIIYLGTEKNNGSITYSLKQERGNTNYPFSIGDEMQYIGYANIGGAIRNSDTITQQQWGNEFILLRFNVTSPDVRTDTVTNITSHSSVLHGTVTSDNCGMVTDRGFYYANHPNPTQYDNVVNAGNGLGTFATLIDSLTEGNTYYVKAFAANEYGTTVGEQISWQTLTVPSVSTSSITNIADVSATGGGIVLSDGGTAIIVRGVCWSTNENPTTADSYTTDGGGLGTFTSTLTGLTSLTTYYVRAYATNSEGTSYGNQVSFTTATLPTVTTSIVGTIRDTSAVAGGNVTNDGGSPVTARGLCWSTNANPTISDNYNTIGSGTGSFSGMIAGLIPQTTYFVRAYATNAVGTAYGDVVSFATMAVPTVSTSIVSEITGTAATGGGMVSSDGGNAVNVRGICWSTSLNPTIANQHTTNGNGLGSFIGNITNLSVGTTYYVRAYATNSIGTGYGNQVSFTTCSYPTITTNSVSNIGDSTAICGGTVVSDGNCTVTGRGVCWSTSQNPTIANSHTEDGSGIGSYISNITNLIPGTTYYIRAYAISCVGVAYGTQVSFTTLTKPTVSTSAISSITDNSATSGGTVMADGGTPVTVRGICWSTSPNPTTADAQSISGNGLGSFSCFISGLERGSTYYVRAFASNSVGTSYGQQMSFITHDVPSISTSSANSITANSAVCGGTVTSDGNESIIARGVCWSTLHNPTINDSHTSDGTGIGSFISNISNLTDGTTYYVRAYATNFIGTSYGNEISFTTPTFPTISTTAASNISNLSATAGGVITSDGGAAVTARGVCWSTSQNPMIYDNRTVDGAGIGTFTSSLTGLSGLTTYFFRAYATNSVGTVYGNQMMLTTFDYPIVLTSNVTDITEITAICGGTVTSDGGSVITERGVCWSTAPQPTIANNKTTDGAGNGNYASQLTSLTGGTTYYVRAYATNQIGTSYGSEYAFTTLTLPTVTTATISNVTDASAISGGSVISDGGTNVISRGVCWSLSQNPTIADQRSMNGSGTGDFVSTLSNLDAGTTYYVRAYATNSVGTAYGMQIALTTLDVPTLSTTFVNNITDTSAVCGGNITFDGGVPVTARGVCWNTTPNPTLANSHTIDGTGTGNFVSNLTALARGTTYYVRSYATNSVGTAYGNQLTFTTPTLPVVATSAVTDITNFSASCGGNVTSDGGLTVTARGVCWSTSANPTTADNLTLDGTGTGSFTSTISGLTDTTTYHIRAYATNSVGTAYGVERVITTPTLPIVDISAVGQITDQSFVSGGNIISDGGATITAKGVCWRTTPTPTINDNKTIDGSGNGNYVSTATGLTMGTTYYVRAYATNCVGTAYSQPMIVTTHNIPTVSTAYFTNVMVTTALGGGNVISGGDTSVMARGLCWSTQPQPTIADAKTVDGMGEGAFTSIMQNLLPATTYYVRAYATNAIGTGYGNELTILTQDTLPYVSTSAVSNIEATTAVCGGEVTAENGQPVTVRGICYATHPVPTTGDAVITEGTGLGIYTIQLTGLECGTTYYVRAFATSGVGTAYGEEYVFTMAESFVPHVSTLILTDITETTARCGGIVESANCSDVSARGVCWSTSENPTISDSHTTDSVGIGEFESSLTGLTAGVTYYVRAYATSEIGTGYGEQMSFTTLNCGTIIVTDVDGNTYTTVQIGAQCWMKENLKTTRYADGAVIYHGRGTYSKYIAYWYYPDDNPSNKNCYGLLYNWPAVMRNASSSNSNPSNVQGICPHGWHVPSVAEWTQLRDYVSSQSQNVCGSDSTYIAKALAGTTDWISSSNTCAVGNNLSQNNTTGFSAIPMVGKEYAFFWSSTEDQYDDDAARNLLLSCFEATVGYYSQSKSNYSAVRCLRDTVSKAVTTAAVSNVTATSATCGGNVTLYGSSVVTARGVCWSTSPAPTVSDFHTIDGAGMGSFTSSLTELTPGSTYYVRAYAIDSIGVAYGEQAIFTPAPTCGTVTDIENNTYTTVLIGAQCWMKENLRTTKYADNTQIENGTETSNNVAYWYYPDDNECNKQSYGLLYNWKAVMRNASYSDSNPSGVQGICPTGWHVPSAAEWEQLKDYVRSQNQYVCGSSTTNIAKALAATTGWLSSSTTCAVGNTPSSNNATGFSALPAGSFYGSAYYDFGSYFRFHSSSTDVSSTIYSWILFLYYNHTYPGLSNILKSTGCSVRCLRDSVTLTVTTTAATNITATSAICGGNVIADGGDTVTARGVCWSTSQNPTLNDSHTTEGSGIGNFTSSLTGLTDNTVYYVRAYATNSNGTAYGDEKSFTTFACGTATIVDAENHTYHTVQIGTQCWMKENLRTTKYADSTVIEHGYSISTTTAYWYYPNNNFGNSGTYGLLYNWKAVMRDASYCNYNPSGVQGICPTGWHVPSDAEWIQLTDYVSSRIQYRCSENSSNIAKALAGTAWWTNYTETDTGRECFPGYQMTSNNATGFSAIPGGYCSGSTNYFFGTSATFWSATECSSDNAYFRSLRYNNAGVYSDERSKYVGHSVRCIRD